MRKSAVKQRGREKKGPPDIALKSFSQKGPKWCSVRSIGVIGKSALEIGQFLTRNFWMIFGGPFLSRPLCFTAEKPQFSEQLSERFPELLRTHLKDFHLPLAFSERLFQELG